MSRFNTNRILAWILFVLICAFHFTPERALGQSTAIPAQDIKAMVAAFKSDPRGPFQGIRWYCPDGSVISPQERCAQPGGIQHAMLKQNVMDLQTRNGLYLGQILAGTKYEDFLDEQRNFSRMKQYQIERFLASADDGWILRLARYYRGAYQAEDEEQWGRDFLMHLLGRNDLLESNYYFVREAVRTIPHNATSNTLQEIRSLAKELADGYAPFMDLRIKIHGQPADSDTTAVKQFMAQHTARLSAAQKEKFETLRSTMASYYRVDPFVQVRQLASRIPANSRTAIHIASLRQLPVDPARRSYVLGELLMATRTDAMGAVSPVERLHLLDISLAVESLLFRTATAWVPDTPRARLVKARTLLQGATGVGLLEMWEWQNIQPAMQLTARNISVDHYTSLAETIKRSVEWGIGMAMAVYEDDMARFTSFEPLAVGFMDDLLRSSLMLPLGETAGAISAHAGQKQGFNNDVMGLANSGTIRGINPGVAVGRLTIVDGPQEIEEFNADEIYIMSRTPAELKPVAGIATVSEGNMVSHVQLLARNLGIPNAVISPELLRSLKPFEGERVFYAISPRGVVRMKPAESMTAEERALIEERKRAETRIRVPIDRLKLNDRQLTSLFDLRASDSGVVCGPKAANLGQLSSLFPGHVAPGFIIPFGVFREHMDQQLPGSSETYWNRLRSIFSEAEAMRGRGDNEERIEQYVLGRLAELRTAIEKMPLKPQFVTELKQQFSLIFGAPIGQTPIFVRSDTNMEDLQDFTGAGLNLTVPNVVTEEAILQAVRNVWASPYRERGYRWRQKYLLNPEDVYPSLLILKSVNVEKSGVIITTGITSGNDDDFTFAFNRGVGGAVDGQAAETYLVTETSFILQAPAREPVYRTLPAQGGVTNRYTSFEHRILSPGDLTALRAMAAQVKSRLPGLPGIETDGPFDVELGMLNDQIYLFQARPFVQNKAASATSYLTNMDVQSSPGSTVDLGEAL